jgi:pteridine reductase
VGGAITLGLADAGFDVVLNYHDSATAARELALRVERAGRRCLLAPADVSVGSEVDALAGSVRREFGRLDLLVNSASLFRRLPLQEVDEPEWDRVMAVNLKGPFLMVRALGPLLAESRGNVVNIVDLSAFQPWVQYPHHAVSKAGLLHLTRVQARALAPHIRVNAIAPGAVLPPDTDTHQERERSRERAALGTLGSPDDVVRTVLFLDRSPFITGEVIVVDGGARLTGR